MVPTDNATAGGRPGVSHGTGHRVLPWLWLSLPIAVLAMTGSLIGIVLDDEIYSEETANWAAQSVGQDIANLVAFPVLLLLALLAGRGSMRAYLGWAGVLVYSAYTTRSMCSTCTSGRCFWCGWRSSACRSTR